MYVCSLAYVLRNLKEVSRDFSLPKLDSDPGWIRAYFSVYAHAHISWLLLNMYKENKRSLFVANTLYSLINRFLTHLNQRFPEMRVVGWGTGRFLKGSSLAPHQLALNSLEFFQFIFTLLFFYFDFLGKVCGNNLHEVEQKRF